MRILLVHHESEYFAGAEKMLGYFLQGLAASACEVTVAAVRESRVPETIPAGMKICWLPENRRFSARKLGRQLGALADLTKKDPQDVIHGWAARDWELTSLAGRWLKRPTVGTLHDHPQAPFLSRGRQRLMSWCARLGLDRMVCVSKAVQDVCVASGYAERKLRVVHNGLPLLPGARAQPRAGVFRLGFLGLFSERKGLRGLFQIVDELAQRSRAPWELALAGDAQEAEGRRLVEELKAAYGQRTWWPQVHWLGWVKQPAAFLSSLDLMICPSSEFDPFPTVLLEAGQTGVPVLGARVGGVPEIIEDGVTGWLFERGAWSEGARRLQLVLESPELASAAGERAKKRVEREFAMKRMVDGYVRVYQELLAS
ncbi:MAG: glycosyltransferase family 4 protein [Verrucomicrobiota bacterium]